MAPVDHFECSRCGNKLSAESMQALCPADGGVLYARYDFSATKPDRAEVASRPADLWRYRDVLPQAAPVTLGEGMTPLLPSRVLPNVWIKDEGLNPTGSFKARGLSLAVTMAKHYGKRRLAIPSAGNAASALAAYCAAAGLEAFIFMPRDVPLANRVECEAFGANVTLVDGLIGDCAKLIAERKQKEDWFDISTLKEPFRVEGKKTMGYEVAEQMQWQLPDAIIYPTGGGVGMIGMWKAFAEMEKLGWLDSPAGFRPRMIAVQATGCAPIVRAFEAGSEASTMWEGAATSAAGLRVPKAYGDYLVLDIIRKSRGTAVAVSEDDIMRALFAWSAEEGIFAAPEGAASLAAYRKLAASGFLKPSDKVVLFNTGSGLKYLDVISEYARRK